MDSREESFGRDPNEVSIWLSYADLNGDGYIKPEENEIIDSTDYYPFGLMHKTYETVYSEYANEQAEKYKYNGKEWQDELDLNMYDFGARGYMPDLGRWTTIDPLAENSRRWSPYNYAYNNPVYFVDPDGMQSWSFSGQEAVDFVRDLQSMLNTKDNKFENDCISCKTKADWQAYYQQAENTAAMIGEDAWGVMNTRLIRGMDEEGHSIFYLDGERMDLRQYSSRADALGSLLGDAALIEGGAKLLKFLTGFFKSGGDEVAAKTGSKVAVQFGKTENQIYHAFRHTDAIGLDRSLVQSTIQNHFKTVSSQVVSGKPFNQIIEIGGQKIQYTVFKLSDGTFNIGRIHGIK